MTEVLDAPRIESIYPGTWTAHLDGMHVNGELVPFPPNSSGTALKDERLTVSFDTGSSYSKSHSPHTLVYKTLTLLTAVHGPRHYVEAVYKDIPGAVAEEYPGGETLWTVPCDAKVTVSLSFG